ncbi:hypothetical protein SLE2022_013910 [Rubroshorea leprosula]
MEMEQYLLEKFSKNLADNPTVHWHNRFSKPKDLIKQLIASSPSSGNDAAIREKLYRLNNLFAECRMLSYSCRFLPDLPALYNIKTNLDEIKEELTKRLKDGADVNGTAGSPTEHSQAGQSDEWETLRETTKYVDASKVHGFEAEVMSLLKLLVYQRGDEGDVFKAIGVVGKEGIGKTTLCQMFLNRPEVKKYFQPRIWVFMGGLPQEERDKRVRIVEQTLDCLGLEEEIVKSFSTSNDLQLQMLIHALHLQLIRKRYLIVFDAVDDAVGEADDWYGLLNPPTIDNEGKLKADRLANGLPKGYGGTVIVTSRYEKAARKMVGREENLHRMGPLPDKGNCWKIFKEEVEKDGVDLNVPNEDDLKREVIQKSAGVPLAAKILGQILYEHEKNKSKSNDQRQQS